MVIVSLRLPSGWEAIESDLETIQNTGQIQRYELNQGKLSIYLDHVIDLDLLFNFLLLFDMLLNKIIFQNK